MCIDSMHMLLETISTELTGDVTHGISKCWRKSTENLEYARFAQKAEDWMDHLDAIGCNKNVMKWEALRSLIDFYRKSVKWLCVRWNKKRIGRISNAAVELHEISIKIGEYLD